MGALKAFLNLFHKKSVVSAVLKSKRFVILLAFVNGARHGGS